MLGILWIAILFKISDTFYQTKTVVVTTPGNSTRIPLAPYGINASDRTFFVFRVRSCGPAAIALTDSEPTHLSEFVFGNKNNTRCDFKADTFTRFSIPCSNACDVSDETWISWKDLDLISYWRMGRGSIPYVGPIGSSLFNYFDPKFFSIYSDTYPAEWQFDVNYTSTTEQSTLTESGTSAAVTTGTDATATVIREDTSSIETTTSNRVTTSLLTCTSAVSFSTQSTVGKVNGSSYCYCSLNKSCETKNYTEEELSQMIDNIVQELKVSIKDTNAYKRRLISAPDDRPSAQRMGEVGAVVICLVILGIVLMDFPRVIKVVRRDPNTENEYKRKSSKRKKKSATDRKLE